METFSRTTRFILTCNYAERIIDPIQSRCQSFQVIPPDKKQVAKQLVDILGKEGVTYQNEDLVTIVNAGYPDIRRVINAGQRQSISGELVIDKESSILNDYKIQLLEILKTKDKKTSFKEIRQLLANSHIRDYSEAFRLLYDEASVYAAGKTAMVIMTLAKYQLSDVQVVDKEINFMAAIIELLGVIHNE